MVIDIFTYNGEADILEIRLNILNDFVDQFIICEAPTTFSGLYKPLYYEQQEERFEKFWPKIKYFVIDENYTPEEIALAESSPNTRGAAHWKHEFLQKESIKKALTHLKDDDVCLIGDVDEIWDVDTSRFRFTRKLTLWVYSYFLNNLSDEAFAGTIMAYYKDIKNECLNHLRSSTRSTDGYHGWHFTSMGGYEEVKRKLESSYTRESYLTPEVENKLKENIENRKDFLGRNFTYTKNESYWPEYLKKNKDKYQHLCLP